MSSTKAPEVTDALHAQRLTQIEDAIREFRTEFRESLKPIAADVKENTRFRERAVGALAILALLVTGAAGWLSFVTYTTIITKQAVETLTSEVRHPGKAPESVD